MSRSLADFVNGVGGREQGSFFVPAKSRKNFPSPSLYPVYENSWRVGRGICPGDLTGGFGIKAAALYIYTGIWPLAPLPLPHQAPFPFSSFFRKWYEGIGTEIFCDFAGTQNFRSDSRRLPLTPFYPIYPAAVSSSTAFSFLSAAILTIGPVQPMPLSA